MANRYRCLVCGAVAEIDLENKRMIVEPRPPKVPPARRGHVVQAAFSFPSHGDCQFNKPLDKIDLSKLEPVDHAFAYEGGVPR